MGRQNVESPQKKQTEVLGRFDNDIHELMTMKITGCFVLFFNS